MTKPTQPARLGQHAITRGMKGAACAWLFPGAGHLVLGARKKALIFCAIVAITVGLGLACDGNLAVVDIKRAPVLTGLQVVGNIALGPIEPVMRRVLYGAVIYRAPTSSAQLTAPVQKAIDARNERFERTYGVYGTAYLMAAGLMNLLLILDAWDLGIGRRE